MSNDALSLYYLPFHFSGCLKIVAGQRCIQIVMSDQKQIQRTDGIAVDEAKPKLKKPRLYRVILINDDYTPMEFVVLILQRIFRKGREEAVQIMLNVHTRGSGVCGVFTAEIAETKVGQVLSFARDNEHPLQCTMEPE